MQSVNEVTVNEVTGHVVTAKKVTTTEERNQRIAEMEQQDREVIMKMIINMRYVPFIQALLSERNVGVCMLPDFVREVHVETEKDDTHRGGVQRLVNEVYSTDSPQFAYRNRGELRYLTVGEFLEKYPCTVKLNRADYEEEKRELTEEMWLSFHYKRELEN